ncbi:STM4015 family protein [Actinoplanes teichomyceticus]|uniref:Leucine rich repeat (LRR) protein n=1 Tax=Actinoplanes teichomyceticus TaxID=1867 RepID=A0A561WKX1_ACTTI|nr:STM4015 family protein [Actinoplanes teichomyceticus]TWG24512.1 leucine rich repeat (LRR) protein [Actinoplanes teichomyceticus]GIF16808.1 hypothetical protein Ate01nite_68400 [Actinoplanes teichomyceticus]
MTFSSGTGSFDGRRVVDYPQDTTGPVAWRVSHVGYDGSVDIKLCEEFRAKFEAFVTDLGPAVESLVIGSWGYAAFAPAPVAQICAAAPRLPRLRSLFLGDIGAEECEISWMKVGDVSPLLTAYPRLETLQVRGGEDFRFAAPVRHDSLRRLVVQSGGLGADFAGAVLASRLPALTDLELWLGVADYGGRVTLDVLRPLLDGELFPNLRRLGLRNAEFADDIAAALAGAPVVQRLESLDLSMGTLGDAGAAALLAGQPLTHLRELNLRFHYMSEQTAAAVVAALPGVRVDVGDPQEPDEYDSGGEHFSERYTAVAE